MSTPGFRVVLAGALLYGGIDARGQAPDPPAATEERLHALESTNRKLLERYEAMEREHARRYDELSREFQALRQRLGAETQGPTAGASAEKPAPGGTDRAEGDDGKGAEAPGGGPQRNGSGPGTGNGPGAGPSGTVARDKKEEARPIKTTVGNGLRFNSADDEFELVFHDLTQVEYRGFPGLGDQSPLHSQAFVPRQRWYFTGRATKNVEFYTVINRGYGSLDLLDAFLNFNYDPRFQVRMGRTKTPTSYEYYKIAEGDLIAPERSLFVGNYAGNRQLGFMAHGVVLDKRAEYAVGLFNGPRRSFGDFNNSKDIYTFFDIRPWGNRQDLPALQYMNLGGAFNYGSENNPTQPSILTTANDQTATAAVAQTLSPTFFAFNKDVVESGPRSQWAAWVAWYVKSFNLLAEYDGGYQDYATSPRGPRTHVPLEGFSVTGYYFLTGEQITRRSDIKPDRPFAIKEGRITGPGAFEVFARYSDLNVGHDVFAAGLADPNLWTNHAQATDLGLNWYLSRYTKIYLDWQHAGFGVPVFNGPRSFTRSTDLLWVRFQLYF